MNILLKEFIGHILSDYVMTTYMGIPDDYKLYMYSALGMMFGGVILLVVSLIDRNEYLLVSSITATTCGFFLSMGMSLLFINKKRKDQNAEIPISILARIILLAAFGFSTYSIIFSIFYMLNNENPFVPNLWIALAIAVPIVVIGLIIADIIINRRRKKKKERKELEEKMRKEFEEELEE